MPNNVYFAFTSIISLDSILFSLIDEEQKFGVKAKEKLKKKESGTG